MPRPTIFNRTPRYAAATATRSEESLKRVRTLTGCAPERLVFHNVDLCDPAALRKVLETCPGFHSCIHFAGLKVRVLLWNGERERAVECEGETRGWGRVQTQDRGVTPAQVCVSARTACVGVGRQTLAGGLASLFGVPCGQQAEDSTELQRINHPKRNTHTHETHAAARKPPTYCTPPSCPSPFFLFVF